MKEQMDSDLRDLLKRGAPGFDAPAGTQERALARIAAALPPTALGSGGGSGSSGAAPTTTTPATLLSGKLLAPMALALLLGGGIGAAVTQAMVPPRVVYVDRPTSSLAPSTRTAGQPSLEAPSASGVSVDELPHPRVPVVPRVEASSEPSSATSALNAERVLLDRGRTALARGDAAACLGLLEEHRTRYPHGALTEEREALAIRTLVALGRVGEARARGRQFKATYPTSLMLPAVEAALGEPAEPE
jgi:hypothetical protein